MKDKGFKILFIISIILVLADLVSTLMNGKLVKYLEANLLYNYGGLPLIILANILFLSAIYFLYKKGNYDLRYYLLFSLVILDITRIPVMISNIMIAQNPPTLEAAMAVTTQMKQAVMWQLFLNNLLPFIAGFFSWTFYKMDHYITKVEI